MPRGYCEAAVFMVFGWFAGANTHFEKKLMRKTMLLYLRLISEKK